MPVDDAEVAALAQANFQEWSRELARASGVDGEICESGGLLRFASRSTFPVLLNGMWRLDPTVDAAAAVADADAFFGARGRGWTLSLRDGHPDDEDLRRAAEAAGIAAVAGSPDMVCEAPVEARPLPEGVTLRWVDDRPTLDDFVAVSEDAYATQGFPRGTAAEAVTELAAFTAPHVHTVIAYDGDTPVAGAQTLLSHSIAGVYWVGTVEAARGRGLGDAVSRAVTNRAFDLGARFVSLQASGMGEPIYRRMGYREVYRYTTYVRFPDPGS